MKKQASKRLSLNRETLKALGTATGAADQRSGSITVCGGNPSITVCSLRLCTVTLCGTLPICFAY